MKTYWIVDRTEYETWEEQLVDHNRDEAIAEAYGQYTHLSKHDRERRLSFDVCYGETDENGCLDTDTATDWIDIVEMYGEQKEKEEEEEERYGA